MKFLSLLRAAALAALFTGSLLSQAPGTINTVAGNGMPGFTGDTGPATSAELGFTTTLSVAPDNRGNLFIVDAGNNRIRKVDSKGIITTYAGGGTQGFMFNVPATSFLLSPLAATVDPAGNVYISGSSLIFKVDSTGTLTLFAGFPGSTASYSGDGGPATNAGFGANSMGFDATGNMYMTDIINNRIRKIDTKGIITTIAGGGSAFPGDGGLGTAASLLFPQGIAVDAAGNVYFADHALYVRKVDTQGIIHTIAGNGGSIGIDENVPAVNEGMNPSRVAVDTAGNLYIIDVNRLRKVDASGKITTFAGGVGNFNLGDGGPATSAQLLNPTGVAADTAGNVFIADAQHYRLREVYSGSQFPPPAGGGGGVPSINSNGVVNGASFSPGVVSNAWATIQGTNLSTVTDNWNNAIVNGRFPNTLDSVSVTIGFAPAYIYFVSPTQINLLVPPNLPPGPQQVVVKNAAGTSATATVIVNSYQPAFFQWPNNQPVATRQDFTLAAANGTFPGTTTAPAKPGEVLILWGTGFGPTIPAVPPGIAVPSNPTYSASTLPTVSINNIPAFVYGAAFAPGFAGLYQIAIQVPSALGNGNWPVIATVGGVSSPASVLLSVHD